MSKYSIHLKPEQREHLEHLIKRGTAPARKIMHAQVLLKTDEGEWGPRWSDRHLQDAFGVGESTLKRIRHRFVQEGLEAALERKRQPTRPQTRRMDGEQEALLVLLACSDAPHGHERWSINLLHERLLELQIVQTVSQETVRMTLKKNELKPWLKKQWCIPSADAKFVAAMEDVLATYQRAYDALHPLICMDEGCMQLLSSKRVEQAMDVKSPRRVDYEYERDGWCNLFVACEPLAGKRVVQVREQRTKKDWAHFMRMVLEDLYPEAEKVVLVMDNLNTHSTASFYEAFPPEVARGLSERLEIHSTPVHGSWLNMAEIELSVLGRQVLGQRMSTMQQVHEAVTAWQERRNRKKACVKWHFTNEQARIKLQRLYPSIEVG